MNQGHTPRCSTPRSEVSDARWRSTLKRQAAGSKVDARSGSSGAGKHRGSSVPGTHISAAFTSDPSTVYSNATTQLSVDASSIGRAVLPGYGTSYRAVNAKDRSARGQTPPRRDKHSIDCVVQSANPELMTAAALNASEHAGIPSRHKGNMTLRTEALLMHRSQQIAEIMHQQQEEDRRAAAAKAAEAWRCKGPQVPFGIPGPNLAERPRVILQQKERFWTESDHENQGAQQLVYPKTQTQANAVGTLLTLGAAGAPKPGFGGGDGTGRLQMRTKPDRAVSEFAEVFRQSCGVHPYDAEPLSSGQWKL
eukprot:TRINITY_DN21471_c0_g1_i1.p1 TRINITY_DN21471_c0_g1~~TRINITY_DN21471_c0_g1_i1.p1  ORF type:complete len:308 (+),score=53.01 TRINITY_DN21471_c0_g1_i1:95-1018(+)